MKQYEPTALCITEWQDKLKIVFSQAGEEVVSIKISDSMLELLIEEIIKYRHKRVVAA